MDKSGLVMEAAEQLSSKSGIKAVQKRIGGVEVTDVRVSDKAQRRIGRPAGRYITLEGGADDEGVSVLLTRALEQVLPRSGRIFAAGLGNPDITQDSLGALVVRQLAARTGCRHSLVAMETDIAAKTGLDTARLVRAAARAAGADCVLVIDALACSAPRRIGKTVQVCDTGISPGSGLSAGQGEISERSTGLPVAALGVPTMAELCSVTGDKSHSGMIVTTADIDITVRRWAAAIALSVNELIG